MTKHILGAIIALSALVGAPAFATDYAIDKQGQHAFVTFKASHLGYSYIIGRFNDFDGDFKHDKDNPGNSSVNVVIQAKSIDTNHAERDKHLRSSDFFDVAKFPTITFNSTSFSGDKLVGDLSMHGVTKSVTLDVKQIGEGKDPWGGYRSGFQGNVVLKAADYGMPGWVGDVDVELIVEGIRK
ncbi:MAG: YceI family protein [Pseudomonadota bacterium]